MTTIDIEPSQWDDHRTRRAEVIHEWGDLWRQAIVRLGIADDEIVEAVLQLCAACHLDGVNPGSCLDVAILLEEQLIRERDIIGSEKQKPS